MRELVDFNEDQIKAYNAGKLIRQYGENTNQQTYGYMDNFFTHSKAKVNGKECNFIRFKPQAFKNLLGVDPPEDIVEENVELKLYTAFTVGFLGGSPKWNVPVKTEEGC